MVVTEFNLEMYTAGTGMPPPCYSSQPEPKPEPEPEPYPL